MIRHDRERNRVDTEATGQVFDTFASQSQRCSKLLPEKRSLPHKSARSRDVTDTEIARVKRSIDQFNQQRNDWIEKVDDEITLAVEKTGVAPEPDALNLIDR